MKTNELLTLQALKYKKQVIAANPDFDIEEGDPDWMRDSYEASGETRNICAFIPLPLFDEINRISGVLSISKRRIVEMALRDFAISANKALDEVGFDAASITYFSAGEVPVDLE